MNRILELASENGFTKMNRRSDGLYVVSEELVVSFAESLVKECAEISLNSGESGEDIARDILYNFNIDQCKDRK